MNTVAAPVRVARLALRRGWAGRAARLGVVIVAVAMFGAVVAFVAGSQHTMGSAAVQAVPIDYQGPVASAQQAQQVAAAVAKRPGVASALPVATSPISGASHVGANGTTQASTGAILAIPASAADTYRPLRMLRGTLQPGKVVLDQQFAATLAAQPGDTVLLVPQPGAKPVPFVVSGVGLVSNSDVIFQPLQPLLGPTPAQPPANIAVMDTNTFQSAWQSKVPSGAASTTSNSAVPGQQSGAQWQVQVQARPDALAGSPSVALGKSTAIKNDIERNAPGRVRFVDDLGDALTIASQDAIYAGSMYLLLVVPGVLAGLGVAWLAALGSAARERRVVALLRVRGAGRRALLLVALVDSLGTGIPAGLLGGAIGLGAARLLVGDQAKHLGTSGAVWTLVGCVVVAVLGAFFARVATIGRGGREQVVDVAGEVTRAHRPLWHRLYLDIVALAISIGIFVLTLRTGFAAVINPDANLSLSLSVYMFLAPALLWIGATLLLVRLRARLLDWLLHRPVTAGDSQSRVPSSLRLVLASASRRGPALNRGLVVVTLLLAFGVSLGVFARTWDQQATVDAQLTLGSDVALSAPPGVIQSRHLDTTVQHQPGVRGVSSLNHEYAYVGPDLQDIFGVDARTLQGATTLRDSYFVEGSASAAMSKLRAHPDSILVSKETRTDYSLNLGDPLHLQVVDTRSGKLRTVTFHVVGTVQEFPSAPRDSFMVANRAYLAQATGAPGPNVLLASTTGDPAAVARRIAAQTHGAGTRVRDIATQHAQTVSSITSVSMHGISRLEEGFALLLTAIALLSVAGLAVADRRRELATMLAIGAAPRTVAWYVWSEIAVVTGFALVLAAVLGIVLAQMHVAMLKHAFDPPPDHLSLPWAYLGSLAGAAVIAAVIAGVAVLRQLGRIRPGLLLREQ